MVDIRGIWPLPMMLILGDRDLLYLSLALLSTGLHLSLILPRLFNTHHSISDLLRDLSAGDPARCEVMWKKSGAYLSRNMAGWLGCVILKYVAEFHVIPC